MAINPLVRLPHDGDGGPGGGPHGEDGALRDGGRGPHLEDRGAYAALFHALAEPTRLGLLEHLSSGEHRVRDLVDHMHLAQSTVSKHLACLRDCGLVKMRSEGRSSWFSLADPSHLTELVESADRLLTASGASLSLRDHRAHDDLVAQEL